MPLAEHNLCTNSWPCTVAYSHRVANLWTSALGILSFNYYFNTINYYLTNIIVLVNTVECRPAKRYTKPTLEPSRRQLQAPAPAVAAEATKPQLPHRARQAQRNIALMWTAAADASWGREKANRNVRCFALGTLTWRRSRINPANGCAKAICRRIGKGTGRTAGITSGGTIILPVDVYKSLAAVQEPDKSRHAAIVGIINAKMQMLTTTPPRAARHLSPH